MSYPSDALRFANKVLRKLGCAEQSELARGRRKQPCICPIANTISAGIETTHPRKKLAEANESVDVWVMHEAANVCVQKWDGDKRLDACTLQVLLPKGARGFAERFDEGKYPQYDSAVRDAS